MPDKNKLGVLCFIGSEGFFFAVLIIAYVYYRAGGDGGPDAASSLDLLTAGIYTALLLASSLTLWRAEKSVEQQRRGRTLLWLLATVLLGGAFLFGQGREYLHLIEQNITVSRNLFGSTFFTLTGVHGLHVLSGLVALLIMLGLALAGDFKGPRAPGLEAVGWYWHFVDAVWIVIFSLVYVWPHL